MCLKNDENLLFLRKPIGNKLKTKQNNFATESGVRNGKLLYF